MTLSVARVIGASMPLTILRYAEPGISRFVNN